MIELVPDLRVINVLAKFENDPWKIGDVGVLTGLVCPSARPPARPLGRRQYPGALKGCGVKIEREWNETETGNATEWNEPCSTPISGWFWHLRFSWCVKKMWQQHKTIIHYIRR